MGDYKKDFVKYIENSISLVFLIFMIYFSSIYTVNSINNSLGFYYSELAGFIIASFYSFIMFLISASIVIASFFYLTYYRDLRFFKKVRTNFYSVDLLREKYVILAIFFLNILFLIISEAYSYFSLDIRIEELIGTFLVIPSISLLFVSLYIIFYTYYEVIF